MGHPELQMLSHPPPGDGVPDCEEDARGGAARAAHDELLLAERLWPLALHLEGAVQARQHGGRSSLDVVVEHQVVAPVPDGGGWFNQGLK